MSEYPGKDPCKARKVSEEITICGENEGVKMDEWSYKAGQNKELKN